MIKNRFSVVLAVGLMGFCVTSLARAADSPDTLSFDKDVTPLLQKYCYQCHGDGKSKGDVALDSFKNVDDVLKARDQWKTVAEKVRGSEMPPDDAKLQPTQAERDLITKWVEQALFKVDPNNPDPGRVTIHRLNRAEYNNTIRDLVGVEFQPADDFPSDDSGYGFDNIGDVLSLPPILMEKYLAAATKILDQAIATQPSADKLRRYNANLMEMGFNADGDRGDGWMPLGTLEEDGVATTIQVPAGEYVVRVYAFAPPPRGRGGGGGANLAAAGGRAGARGFGGGRGGRGGRRGGAAAAPASAPAADGAAAPAPANGAANDGGGDADPAAQQVAVAPATAPTSAPAEAAAPAAPALPSLKLALMLDNSVVHDWTVTSVEAEPGVYEYHLGVPAGKHRFAIVNRRLRGGAYELEMKNGRMGHEQGGTVWVKWVEIEGPVAGAMHHYPANKLETVGDGKFLDGGTRLLDHNGEVATKINIPHDGEYLLRAQAYADQCGDQPAKMEFRIDGQAIQTFDVIAPGNLVPLDGQRVFSMELLKPMPYVYEYRAKLTAGEKRFSAAFINDHVEPDAQNPNLRDRNLYIDYLEISDPNSAQPLPAKPPQIAAMFAAAKPQLDQNNKLGAARTILDQFTQRAWRRPVQTEELNGLVSLFESADKDGQGFDDAIKLPLKAVLVSPYFLYRGEIQSDPDNPKSIHQINEFQLASRLSYFLWSSTPDDELLGLAARGELRKNLEAQVHRMMASPKASALTENFAGQWLQTRNLKFVAPDKDLFYDYDPSIGKLMATETETFFEHIMREDRNVIEFLNADYTYLNDTLARYYGIDGVTGSDFQKVSLKGTPRAGVITQGSVLVITSNPTRTSPVKRGKWVLENLLGTPPPPPPPEVPPLKNDGKPETGSLRHQMEEHRANPSCASCHARMDPIGFGLENFDAVGRVREKDGEFPVDTAGELVTGEKFAGAKELSNILATKKRGDFLHCLTEKMLTYAIGRGMEYYDRPSIDDIVAQMEKNDDKFSSLIIGVVNSVPFQMRRGDGTATAMAK